MISLGNSLTTEQIGPVDQSAPLPQGTLLAFRNLSGQDMSDLAGLAAGAYADEKVPAGWDTGFIRVLQDYGLNADEIKKGNVAAAIVIGSFMIGICYIIGRAVGS